MKKNYFFIFLFLLAQFVYAQTDTIFSDDFSDPSNWIMQDLSTSGNQNWVIGASGPIGGFSGPMGVIQSTTNANGFAMYDSDGLTPPGTGSQNALLIYNGVVDCSSDSNINFNFQSYHRKYLNTIWLEVATDSNFTNFESYEIDAALGITYASDNPEFVSIDISSTAGNQAVVYFRFRYMGGDDYAWMIDDVLITPVPDYSITCTDGSFSSINNLNNLNVNLDVNYTFYPISQAILHPYRFQSVISNNGLQDLSSVIMHVEVEKDLLSWNLYSDTESLISGQVDTFFTNSDFTPDNLGLHNFIFSADNDTLCSSESFEMKSMVTDTVYGVDYDWDTDGSSAGGGYNSGTSNCGQVLGNVFNIYKDQDTLYYPTWASSISFHVNNTSSIGASLKVELYKIDELNNSQPTFTLIDSSQFITLGTNDIDSWVTIALHDSILSSGNIYLAAVRGKQESFTSTISSASNSNSITFLQDNGCNLNSGDPFGTWYTLSHSLLIRLNIEWEDSLHLSYNDINSQNDIIIFPNPTSGIFSIILKDKEDYKVTVQNIVGQLVYEDYVRGDVLKNIDLSNYKSGIYIVNIETSTSTYSHKVILE